MVVAGRHLQAGVPRLGLHVPWVYPRLHGVRDACVSHPVGRCQQKPLCGSVIFILHQRSRHLEDLFADQVDGLGGDALVFAGDRKDGWQGLLVRGQR